MKKIDLISTINGAQLNALLETGNFGIERENLRVTSDGHLALTPFPKIFGDKATNPYITVDFSESQIELITPTFNSLDMTYNFLENLNDIVTTSLENEYLWPESIPCILPSEQEIPIAKFQGDQGKIAMEYRENLAKKYGKKIQMLSGIHFNFSFSNKFLKELHKNSNTDISFKHFKNELYMKVTRNYFKYGWLIIYLLGASSTVHKSYRKECTSHMDEFSEDIFYSKNTLSFRNGRCGYRNKDEFYISHDHLENYIKDIEELIDKGILQGAREYYSPIRLKSKDPKNILDSLKKDGIEYLEIRSIDINPFIRTGIELNDLKFIHILLIYFLLKEEEEFTEEDYKRYLKNQELLASEGRNKNFTLICCKGKNVKVDEYSKIIISDIENLFTSLNIYGENISSVLNFQLEKINNPDLLYVNRLLKGIENEGFVNFNINKCKQYLQESKNMSYSLKGYEDLELSTQILLKDAIRRGIHFEILDRKENFILLKKEDKEEYIKQATKTSLDSYVTVLIMENKVVTKKVLEKHHISVPKGRSFDKIQEAFDSFDEFKNMPIVIKPKSTNFGLGISIFTNTFTQEEFNQAISFAFKEDSTILIEEFISGKEYRFLVLGDEVAGILHRVPANVIGDGNKNIIQLVEEKNKSSLRGKGYKTPLEKINLGDLEKLFLSNKGLSFEYIPQKNETVYLRENSNISTGGDSIDFTDDILDIYKQIAIKASKAANAKICGVDMIINDIHNPNPTGNYSIIEINFNPAIHIHCFPYIGKQRKIGDKILTLLGF